MLQTNLDQHVLLTGRQVHGSLKHVHCEVDDVRQQVLIARDLLQVLLDCVPDLVLGGQEHGQVLGLLQSVRVCHYLQELSRPSQHNKFYISHDK